MTRFRIGLDYEGVGSVKITKGSYDPRTTPDSQRDRFFFNSKWENILSQPNVELADFVTGTSYTLQPTGSSAATATRIRCAEGTGVNRYHYRLSRFPSVRYTMPMIDVKYRASNGRFKQGSYVERRRGYSNSFGVMGGYISFYHKDVGTWFQNYDDDIVWPTIGRFTLASGCRVDVSDDTDAFIVVWNLPGNNVALDGPTSSPSPAGKKAVEITATQCRVAKPGYDVRTATPAQLAFDANGLPLNVIAASDIAVPNGTTAFDTGITLPANTVAEVQFYTGTSIAYPGSPRNEGNQSIEYAFSGSSIIFYNSGSAVRARFMIFGSETTGPSSGSNKVMRRFTSGGENVVQLLRPGSADPPRFSDIIVDTRRPVIQILASGYINLTSTGDGATSSITYDASGFFPLVKFTTVHGGGSEGGQYSYSASVRAPRVSRLLPQIVSGQNQNAGDSAHCIYDDTGATFYTNRGKPIDRYYNSLEVMQYEYDPTPYVGIRWHVLGIPA